jgi:hypothetical protein
VAEAHACGRACDTRRSSPLLLHRHVACGSLAHAHAHHHAPTPYAHTLSCPAPALPRQAGKLLLEARRKYETGDKLGSVKLYEEALEEVRLLGCTHAHAPPSVTQRQASFHTHTRTPADRFR